MNWLTFAVQWLHVLLGITWFGYSVSMYFLVAPPLAALAEGPQRDAFHRLGVRGARVMPFVSLGVLLLGILRGTVFGPIQTWEALFGTAYGITWIVALVATVALIVLGARFLGPSFEAMRDAPDLGDASARVRRYSTLDLGLFGVVFTCMILMRFGL